MAFTQSDKEHYGAGINTRQMLLLSKGLVTAVLCRPIKNRNFQ